MGFTPRPASGHSRPVMTQQSCTIRTYSVKVGVTGTGADATFVMKIRIKNYPGFPLALRLI